MKIIITNAYCYLNKGDAGIIRAMVQEFRKRYPNAEIKVVSLFKDLDIGKYGDCEVIDCIIKPYTGKNRLLKTIRNVLLLFWIWLLNFLSIPFNNTVREIKKADIIVSCGGGYFKARNLAQFLGDFMYHYIQFVTAIQYKKKFIVYAQTVGEFGSNSFVQNRIKYLLKKAELVLPREPISFQYLMKFVPKLNNYFETSDVAFLLEKKELKSKEINDLLQDNGNLKIGLTMRFWHFPGSSNRKELLDQYKSAVKESIQYLLANYKVDIFLMPQCVGPGEDNDLIISREIYQSFSGNNKVHLLDQDFIPEELKYVYSRMDLFVGTRMHSNIFSLSEGVPCVAISYDLKTDGIMQAVGLQDYVLDIKGIESKELILKLDKALNDLPRMKDILHLNIPRIIQKAKLNNNLLYKIIEGGKSTTSQKLQLGELLDA
ncbi:polysaccharide pyruvyl transferase family protein [Paenibacillus sp. Soil787]|uniref:polysaccharide pyruvyl transferase family protein n=1 Tax=Paenibacillus sp. Soil787 TaxID=1736411 RepID=UPI0006FDD1A2|nr:polysaccharide pyruvyl transferase family protein [Paenibacillus sp. Soil787]KRF35877.1 hypothetical protein ASG93_25680 [Paenibacillus sp. Soil787]